MSVDPRALEFAGVWLHAGGWANDIDKAKLAFLIEDLCQDFVADLENMAEAEQEDDK